SFLGSVSTIYGSSGQVLETIYRGDASRPGFVLDNVFNPYTGALWEQFETLPPPKGYSDIANGTQVVTEFNTGDNPNWNYDSWGSNAHVSIIYQDYYVSSVRAAAPVPVGATETDAYGTHPPAPPTPPTTNNPP